MDRRDFLRLFGLASAAIASGATTLPLPEAIADLATKEGIAVQDLGDISRWLQEVYSSKEYFAPFAEEWTPFLSDIERP